MAFSQTTASLHARVKVRQISSDYGYGNHWTKISWKVSCAMWKENQIRLSVTAQVTRVRFLTNGTNRRALLIWQQLTIKGESLSPKIKLSLLHCFPALPVSRLSVRKLKVVWVRNSTRLKNCQGMLSWVGKMIFWREVRENRDNLTRHSLTGFF